MNVCLCVFTGVICVFDQFRCSIVITKTKKLCFALHFIVNIIPSASGASNYLHFDLLLSIQKVCRYYDRPRALFIFVSSLHNFFVERPFHLIYIYILLLLYSSLFFFPPSSPRMHIVHSRKILVKKMTMKKQNYEKKENIKTAETARMGEFTLLTRIYRIVFLMLCR